MTPFDIQRVPLGLQNVLNLFGPGTPPRIGQELCGVLELLQYYGLMQRQVTAVTNAATAEGTSVDLVLSTTVWSVLFGAEGQIVKTATMTAARLRVALLRGGLGQISQGVVCEECGPFGATETGTAAVPWWAPYPVLCPPGTIVRVTPQIIGTDANAAVTAQAEFGLFG